MTNVIVTNVIDCRYTLLKCDRVNFGVLKSFVLTVRLNFCFFIKNCPESKLSFSFISVWIFLRRRVCRGHIVVVWVAGGGLLDDGS